MLRVVRQQLYEELFQLFGHAQSLLVVALTICPANSKVARDICENNLKKFEHR